jgi:hypothetical protein
VWLAGKKKKRRVLSLVLQEEVLSLFKKTRNREKQEGADFRNQNFKKKLTKQKTDKGRQVEEGVLNSAEKSWGREERRRG